MSVSDTYHSWLLNQLHSQLFLSGFYFTIVFCTIVLNFHRSRQRSHIGFCYLISFCFIWLLVENFFLFYSGSKLRLKVNNPGPAQVGAISKAQKEQKDFEVSSILFYSTRKPKIFRKKFSKKLHTQKNWRGPFGENFFSKKSRSAETNERGDPLVSPGMVCYAEKQKKPFWFTSLGQIVQFCAIIFCRTFKNYFGQFVWIEKKSL